MVKVVSLIVVLASSALVGVSGSDQDLKPVCVCQGCDAGSIVGTEKHAALLGEAYLRIKFGDEEVSKIKPIVAYFHKRQSGDYWEVFGGERSKKTGQYDTVLIDQKTGCLLFAYEAH